MQYLQCDIAVPSIQCAIAAIGLEHRDANQSVMKFLRDLVHNATEKVLAGTGALARLLRTDTRRMNSQVDPSLQVCQSRTCVRTCDGWPNGCASRLASSRKSYCKFHAFEQITNLQSNCVGLRWVAKRMRKSACKFTQVVLQVSRF